MRKGCHDGFRGLKKCVDLLRNLAENHDVRPDASDLLDD